MEEKLTRCQDPTINDLIKENLELKRKLGEADDAVEYWQIECDKRSKVLDKIKEILEKGYKRKDGFLELNEWQTRDINKLLEEIE